MGMKEYREMLQKTESSLRHIIMNELGNICGNCSRKGIEIHHPKYKPGMKVKDLILLCKKCHGKIPKKKWKLDLSHYKLKIINLFEEYDILTINNISKLLNVTRVTIIPHINKLVKEGIIIEEKGYIFLYSLKK